MFLSQIPLQVGSVLDRLLEVELVVRPRHTEIDILLLADRGHKSCVHARLGTPIGLVLAQVGLATSLAASALTAS